MHAPRHGTGMLVSRRERHGIGQRWFKPAMSSGPFGTAKQLAEKVYFDSRNIPRGLNVVSQELVDVEPRSADRRPVVEASMRSVPVVFTAKARHSFGRFAARDREGSPRRALTRN